MTPSPTILWLLTICLLLFFAWAARETYLSHCIQERRQRLKAQRLMLRFCQHPTRARWTAAWDFITDQHIQLGELDWPLVQRFTRTGVSVNFSSGERTA